MISIAESNLKKIHLPRNVTAKTLVVPEDPLIFFKEQKDHSFDIIICSLGIMYMEKEQELLREMHRVLTKDGHLITAHWTHPSKNQMLRVLKTTGAFMAGSLEEHSGKLENEDHSFRFWRNETFHDLIENAQFSKYTKTLVNLPMEFNHVLEIIGFSESGAPWFSSPTERQRAIDFAQDYVAAELELGNTKDIGPFKLSNECAIIIASA